VLKINMAEEIKEQKVEAKKVEKAEIKAETKIEPKEELTQAEEIEKAEQEQEEKKEDKKPKKERVAVLYITTSKNNTTLNLTDMAGHTLSRSTGGQSTKQDRLKSSPTVAMFAAKKISEDAKEHGITELYVRIKAETGETSPSSAAHAVVKSLSRDDFKIISIMDITKNPRGGPKKAGGRRGRRV
jgi:small subunit ribosomal protein S11